MLPRLGSVPLRKLDGMTLSAFYGQLLAGGATGARSPQTKGRPLSDKTVRNVAGLLHKAFKDGVRWGVLSSNPADAAELPRRSAPEMRRGPSTRSACSWPAPRATRIGSRGGCCS